MAFSSLTPRRNNTPQTPARQNERIAEGYRRAISGIHIFYLRMRHRHPKSGQHERILAFRG